MKNRIPSYLFLEIWLQKLSSCYVSLSDWFTESEISNYYQAVHFLLQTKLFLETK